MNETYKRQASLLLNVLPEVAKEKCFALHGGTAINLFLHNMPRLSVDIDIVYLPIEDRDTSLDMINKALENTANRIKKILKGASVQSQKDISKLQVSYRDSQIKIEVNQIIRGCISPPIKLHLCEKAQEIFDVFCTINVVPKSQLYGGKIIAALDRQHPRDIFDIKNILDREVIDDETKTGFLFSLLSSKRPIYEILNPNRIDQAHAFEKQFDGMSTEVFSYTDFKETREKLIRATYKALTPKDKAFLISFKNLDPKWDIYDFNKYPSIQWKLENLKKFKSENRKGYEKALLQLTDYLT